MVEVVYNFSTEDSKVIEKLIDDEPVLINHMVLAKGDSIPEHYANSNVYMIVIRGVLSLQLNDQDTHKYPGGRIINVPYNTKMNVSNSDSEVAEFFVVKSPNPKKYME